MPNFSGDLVGGSYPVVYNQKSAKGCVYRERNKADGAGGNSQGSKVSWYIDASKNYNGNGLLSDDYGKYDLTLYGQSDTVTPKSLAVQIIIKY